MTFKTYCAGCGKWLASEKAMPFALSYHDECVPIRDSIEEFADDHGARHMSENRVTSELRSLGSMLDQINHPPVRIIKNDRN